MGFSVELLNNIRMNSSEEYQANIPEATRTNLATIGQAFETYTMLYNEFCTALINKIGKTIISQKMFENRLARFKSGGVVSPHDVEEIFIEMSKNVEVYDPEGKNPKGRRNPAPAKVIYHRENRKDCYPISIGDIDFRRVFRSEDTLDTFIRGQINAVYSRDAYDEWLCMKNLIGSYKDKTGKACGYFDYDVIDMEQEESKEVFAKNLVKALRKAVQDLSFPSTQYNVAGVQTWNEPSDLVLLINKDVLVEVDVEMLARAFHKSDTDMKVVPTIIPMDDFGSLGDTYGILVDAEWFKVFDTLFHMETERNAQGLFTNYFLHHHQILSASTFKNAVRLHRVDKTV